MNTMATEDTSSKYDSIIIEYSGWSYGELAAILSINTTIGVSNIAINGFLIHALRKLKLIKTTSYRLMMYLCISDVSIGVLQLGLQMVPFSSRATRDILNIIMQFIIYQISPFSALMIALIALDRYIHMKYLMRYNTIMTQAKCKKLVLLNIIVNFCSATLMTFSSLFRFYYIYHTIFTAVYMLVILLTCIIYIATYKAIRNRTKIINLNRQNSSAATSQRETDKAFATATLFILISLFICFVPYHGLMLVRSVVHLNGNLAQGSFLYVLLWAIIGSYANGSLNALALIFFSKKVRRYTLKCLKCRRGQVDVIQVTENAP